MTDSLEGGYNYQFVKEPPDSLKCLICLSVVKEPQQHAGCGKLFCKVCIDHYKLQSRNDCPYCRKPLASLFPDIRGEQEVKSLLVKCTTYCGWTGEVRLVEDHKQKDCPNTLMPCPRGCNNRLTKVIRRNLQAHLLNKCPNRPYTCLRCDEEIKFSEKDIHARLCSKRWYTCPYCKEGGTYEERTTTHYNICEKVTIECPKCSNDILRSNKLNHSSVCPNEPVRCKYYSIGCGERPLRKYLTIHEENAQMHLELAIDKIARLISKNTLTFKINKFKEMKTKRKIIFSSTFSTSEQGYKMCLRIDTNGEGDATGTHISVFACLMKGDHDDTLTWPFTGSVTFELLNQLEDKNHHKRTTMFLADQEASQRVVNSERRIGFGKPAFISFDELDYNASTNTQYLKDDTLVFRVSAEAPDHKPWLE